MEVLEGAVGGFHVEATNAGGMIVAAILLAEDTAVATEEEPEAMRLIKSCIGVDLGVYWYFKGSDC